MIHFEVQPIFDIDDIKTFANGLVDLPPSHPFIDLWIFWNEVKHPCLNYTRQGHPSRRA